MKLCSFENQSYTLGIPATPLHSYIFWKVHNVSLQQLQMMQY